VSETNETEKPATPGTGPSGGPAPAPTGEAAGAATEPELRSIDEFARFEFKVGTIRSAEAHPKADRLVVLQVDLGEPADRQIVAGIRAAYAPEDLVGRQVVVVANLRPAILRGIESRGMLLAASDADGLALVRPERTTAPGSKVK
jgi:methionyl-tRNA synthetase